MTRTSINKEKLPDIDAEEIEIFPHGDATMPRIGVLKFTKGTSKLDLDEGQLPYRSMNPERR